MIEPQPECLVDDGFRMRPSMDELNEFTRLMIQIMNELGVKYHVIRHLDPNDRCQFIIKTCWPIAGETKY